MAGSMRKVFLKIAGSFASKDARLVCSAYWRLFAVVKREVVE
jgi:hypothetical protein